MEIIDENQKRNSNNSTRAPLDRKLVHHVVRNGQRFRERRRSSDNAGKSGRGNE